MPNGPYGKRAPIIRAEEQARDDLLPARALCCLCDWPGYEGTAIECRLAAAQHRADAHPQLKVQKRRRGNVSKWNPGLESDRLAGEQNAASVARMLQREVA